VAEAQCPTTPHFGISSGSFFIFIFKKSLYIYGVYCVKVDNSLTTTLYAGTDIAMPLNTYCHACEALFGEFSAFGATPVVQGVYPGPRYIPFNRIQGLMDGATWGCHFCSLVLAQMAGKDTLNMVKSIASDQQNVQDQMYVSVQGHYSGFKEFSSRDPPPALIPAMPDNWRGTPRLQLVKAGDGDQQDYEELCDLTVISDTSSEWAER